jgi:hypothetical protein
MLVNGNDERLDVLVAPTLKGSEAAPAAVNGVSSGGKANDCSRLQTFVSSERSRKDHAANQTASNYSAEGDPPRDGRYAR